MRKGERMGRMRKEQTTLMQKILLLIFSFVLTAIILQLGFGKQALLLAQRSRSLGSSSPATGEETYRILTLGESTTAGTGAYTWPAQLETILNNRSNHLRFVVYNEAVGSLNTYYIIQELDKNLQRYDPDMVVTMMGVNDRGYNLIYKQNIFEKLFSGIANLLNLQKSQGDRKNPIFEISHDESEDLEETEKSLIESLKLNESDDGVLIRLGYLYMDQNRLNESKEMFEKALSLDPDHESEYLVTGIIYEQLGDVRKAEEYYMKLNRLYPENERAYVHMAIIAQKKGDDTEAENIYRALLEINPESAEAYTMLGLIYKHRGMINESAGYMKKALSIDKNNIEARHTLDSIENKEAFEDYDITKYHYNLLYDILKRTDIKYVAMQYPSLSVDILRQFFSSEDQKDILFVSNQQNFETALETMDYNDLFSDDFADQGNNFTFKGKFGHATAEGNMLIAENLASEILKELELE
ncbi:tetratricopeptide repeat protein [Candidatus Woesearchaeota archaeon]|nr:tetratricopeptide repeat protein [Candidatus Woesearchaeota archaeon]